MIHTYIFTNQKSEIHIIHTYIRRALIPRPALAERFQAFPLGCESGSRWGDLVLGWVKLGWAGLGWFGWGGLGKAGWPRCAAATMLYIMYDR